MTKSKPKPVPVLAWCRTNEAGDIQPEWCDDRRRVVAGWVDEFGGKLIRVEIRPAPKRRKVAGVKS